MATSSVNYKYFSNKSSEAFGGAWAQIYNRTLHQPMDLSQVQPNLDYFNLDLNDNGSTANMYKGQIVVVTSDNSTQNTNLKSTYSPFDDKTGRTGPYLIYGYNASTGINGSYYADRILTYSEQQAHYVRKYDLGSYYSGVGEWWQITRSTNNSDKELANIYRDSVKEFTNEQAIRFSYGEIFNDYTYNRAGSYAHAEGYHTYALGYASSTKGTNTITYGDFSHAEGRNTYAKGHCSHAEGRETYANGDNSHVEGITTTTNGKGSHAEGYNAYANGDYSHAEGNNNKAIGVASHAEGYHTYANKVGSHTEGYYTFAIGDYSHAEGCCTYTNEDFSHAEGYHTYANGSNSHAEGWSTYANGNNSHAEGYNTTSTGIYSHTEGQFTKSNGNHSHAEGNSTLSYGIGSHAEGYSTYANGNNSHAEGYSTYTNGNSSHAEGRDTYANGDNSHAEGNTTTAIGDNSHAEGYRTYANGHGSHVEGVFTYTNGEFSHAEGYSTYANGNNSHAEGYSTYANGGASHTEGFHTYANGEFSHAEGYYTYTLGKNSHAGGNLTYTLATSSIGHGTYIITNYESQAAFGKYNGNGTSTYTNKIFEIGIGTRNDRRKNAFDIDINGNTYIYGSAYIVGNINNGSLTNVHIHANHTYAPDTTVAAVNTQILTYAYMTSDGNFWTTYKARPVLSLNNNDNNLAFQSLTVSDHAITVNRVNLAVTTGTDKAIAVGDGATELSEDSTKGHRFVTGITQAANGKITYQVTDIYTPGLSISDTGTGTFMTGISVSDHKITVSRANPTAPNNGALNIYISNTSTNGTQDLCDFTANKSTASNVYLNNIALTNSANTFSGNQTAPAWYISSDINYKDIIDDCRTTLDEIAELPIFDYTWKLDESKTTRTGSSAQAVEKILPNLITEDNEGIKSLDYATLGTVAGIIACREIKNLKDKIDRLERLLLEKK